MKINGPHILQIILCYVIIGLSGYLTWKYSPIENEVLTFLLSDVVMTLVCFFFSVVKKNSSVYDAYWSLIPFYFVLMWSYLYGPELSFHHYAVFAVISLWSWRLTLNWARSWAGFSHEDWRYINLKKQNGRLYPLVNFFGIHLFPTLLVFAGMWPIFYIFSNELSHSGLLYFGILISFIGTAFEFFADNQLAAFRRQKQDTEQLLDSGLWAKCRNPNYLGEMLFWIGLFIIGLAYQAPLYTALGAIAMIGLFVFISIPMKEKRMLERRPAYTAYMQEVPKLIPRL